MQLHVFHSVVAANGEELELLSQGEIKVAGSKELTQECLIGADFIYTVLLFNFL